VGGFDACDVVRRRVGDEQTASGRIDRSNSEELHTAFASGVRDDLLLANHGQRCHWRDGWSGMVIHND
jgi:hypothetical protein